MRKYLLFFFLGAIRLGFAQDLHLSQPDLQSLVVSPALCATNATFEAQGTYRQQWLAAGAPFQTQLLSVHARSKKVRPNEGYLGLGLQVQRDLAAQSLSNSALRVNLAYHLPLSRNAFVSAGINLGFGQRTFEPSGQWGGQYNGLSFDANVLPSISLQNRYAFTYLDAGLGFAYAYSRGVVREKTLSKVQLGFGAHHLNKPGFSFLDANARLQPRIALLAQAEFSLASVHSAVEPLLFYQFQSPAQELLIGCAYKQYLKGGPYSRVSNVQSVGFGLFTRFQDAMVLQFKLQIRQLKLACAYDITVSSFAKGPRLQSAFELQLNYLFE
jgi:type IX secretion system PorP/SprF family membrane protein